MLVTDTETPYSPSRRAANRRKSAPACKISERYPMPDPKDPFAPLWVLRVRQAGSSSDLASLDQEASSPTVSYPSPPASPVSYVGGELDFSPRVGHYRNGSSGSRWSDKNSSGLQRRRSQPVGARAEQRDPTVPRTRYKYQRPQTSISPSTTVPAPSTNWEHLRYNSSTNTLELSPRNASNDQQAEFKNIDTAPLTFADDMSHSPADDSAQFDHLLRFKSNFKRVRSPLALSSSLPPLLSESPDFRHLSAPSRPNKLRHRKSTSGSTVLEYSSRLSPFSFAAEVNRSSLDEGRGHFNQGTTSATITASVFLPRKRARSLPKLTQRLPTSAGRTTSKDVLDISHKRPEDQSVLPPFDQHALPTEAQLTAAASFMVIAESGVRVEFGDLWKTQKTVVCFIRHFWCPLCQDYMFSISRNVDPIAVRNADVRLVIISNGSYNMIKSYRQIFHTPFEVFTDPTLQLYSALGMTLRTLDGGSEEEKGAYVRHGVVGGIAMVIVNAVKAGMPVWEKGGDVSQLGGEFVLGPGLECSYAHRMRTTRNHAPILNVMAVAGVDMVVRLHRSISMDDQTPVLISEDEEKGRLAERQRNLAMLKEKKGARRRLGVCGESCQVVAFASVSEDGDCGTGENAVMTDENESLSAARIEREEREWINEMTGTEDHDSSWEKVIMNSREVGNLAGGYWRRGLENWDVIVDKYMHAQDTADLGGNLR